MEHPFANGTRVDVDIAQGLSVCEGIITASEYDDGWAYRIDVTSGDRCDMHRRGGNPDAELWVCEFEVTPKQEGG